MAGAISCSGNNGIAVGSRAVVPPSWKLTTQNLRIPPTANLVDIQGVFIKRDEEHGAGIRKGRISVTGTLPAAAICRSGFRSQGLDVLTGTCCRSEENHRGHIPCPIRHQPGTSGHAIKPATIGAANGQSLHLAMPSMLRGLTPASIILPVMPMEDLTHSCWFRISLVLQSIATLAVIR